LEKIEIFQKKSTFRNFYNKVHLQKNGMAKKKDLDNPELMSSSNKWRHIRVTAIWYKRCTCGSESFGLCRKTALEISQVPRSDYEIFFGNFRNFFFWEFNAIFANSGNFSYRSKPFRFNKKLFYCGALVKNDEKAFFDKIPNLWFLQTSINFDFL